MRKRLRKTGRQLIAAVSPIASAVLMLALVYGLVLAVGLTVGLAVTHLGRVMPGGTGAAFVTLATPVLVLSRIRHFTLEARARTWWRDIDLAAGDALPVYKYADLKLEDKVYRHTGRVSLRFVPMFAPPTLAYTAEASAVCPDDKPGLPHEHTASHRCGFYAYHRHGPRPPRRLHRALSGHALLTAELWGRFIDGHRNVVQGQYQRVLCVALPGTCQDCRFLPRPSAMLAVRHDLAVRAVCLRHAQRPHYADRRTLPAPLDLTQARSALATEVEFRQDWLTRLSRRVYGS